MVRANTQLNEVKSSAVVQASNQILEQAFRCDTEEELAKTCLLQAEGLTGSAFGWLGELTEAGRLDIVAMTDPGWEACRMPSGQVAKPPQVLKVRGIWSTVVQTGCSQIINEPAAHPASVGVPEGHPELRCYLGVPLLEEGKLIGMVSLANKVGGYTAADRAAIEALAIPIVQTLLRKRAEAALVLHREHLEQLVGRRTADLEAQKGRTEHRNAVLRAVRNVNQLIVVETEPVKLIGATCDELIETRGYHHAWIALRETADRPRLCAQAGLGETFQSVGAAIEQGDWPPCCQVLADQPLNVIAARATECGACPLARYCSEHWTVTASLGHVGQPCGVMGLALPAGYAGDEEELGLIREVAADLGLAIHGIGEREARQRAESELRLMETVFEVALAATSTAGLDGIIEHVNPAFLELWGYESKEQAIGGSVASFFANPDDAAPVLEAPGTTGQWRGEFFAKRTDGSTFVSRGYSTVVRDESGEAIGYQSAHLDVTAERQAQDRRDKLLAAVTGVVDSALERGATFFFTLHDEREGEAHD